MKMRTSLLIAALAMPILATSAQAQTTCIHDYRGSRCYTEEYAPRNHYRNDYHYDRGYHARRYEYDAPRRRNRHRDVVLGLTLGVGSAIILNEIYRRR